MVKFLIGFGVVTGERGVVVDEGGLDEGGLGEGVVLDVIEVGVVLEIGGTTAFVVVVVEVDVVVVIGKKPLVVAIVVEEVSEGSIGSFEIGLGGTVNHGGRVV